MLRQAGFMTQREVRYSFHDDTNKRPDLIVETTSQAARVLMSRLSTPTAFCAEGRTLNQGMQPGPEGKRRLTNTKLWLRMLACSSSLLFTNPMGVWELQPRNFYESVLTGSRRARGFRRRRFFSTGDQDSLFFFKRCSRGHLRNDS